MNGLLECILEKSEKEYISDLSGAIQETCVKEAVKEISCGDYDITEWMSVINYLTGKKHKFNSLEEVVMYIKNI